MPTKTTTDARTQVYRNLRDTGDTADTQLLSDTEIDSYVVAATNRLSLLMPRVAVEDATADGTNTLALPAGFDTDFSRIAHIETPTGNNPPTIMDPRWYFIYQSPSGYSIRFISSAPGNGDTVRIAYTATRAFAAVAADTTVRDIDFEAVCALATSLGAEAIAGKYARQHEPIIGADVSSHQATKVEEWQRIATRFRTQWDKHSAFVGRTSGRVNWDTRQSVGYDHLTHPRRLR